MRLNSAEESVGCLLMGEFSGGRMDELRRQLDESGVKTVDASKRTDRWLAAQEGLFAARRHGGTCIAAGGGWWPEALALAAQLNVDRVALIFPERSEAARYNPPLGFLRRNLFFCVADVLVLENAQDVQMTRELNSLFRRMCNARVWRMEAEKTKVRPLETAARFLAVKDWSKRWEDDL